jgi:hypothetical protein
MGMFSLDILCAWSVFGLWVRRVISFYIRSSRYRLYSSMHSKWEAKIDIPVCTRFSCSTITTLRSTKTVEHNSRLRSGEVAHHTPGGADRQYA